MATRGTSVVPLEREIMKSNKLTWPSVATWSTMAVLLAWKIMKSNRKMSQTSSSATIIRPQVATLGTLVVLSEREIMKSNKPVFLTPTSKTLASTLMLGAADLHQSMLRTPLPQTRRSPT